MSVVRMNMDAPPDAVFNVLTDGESYGDWVVGSKRIRRVDAAWPARGSAFYHSIGAGPLTVHDMSEVVAIRPPDLLELEVHIHPLLIARVRFDLESRGDATALTMTERITGGWLSRARFALDPIMKLRNVVSLRRLQRLARRAAHA